MTTKRRPLTPEELAASMRLRTIWEAKRHDLRLTQESAGQAMEISQGTVAQYLGGKIPLNTPVIKKFAALLKIAPREIDDRLADVIEYQQAEALSLSRTASGGIPLIQWDAVRGFVEEGARPSSFLMPSPVPRSAHEPHFAVQVIGSRMQPDYRQDDYLYVRIDNAHKEPGSDVIALTPSGPVFMRITQETDGLYLRSLSDPRIEMRITDDVRIIGHVVCSCRFRVHLHPDRERRNGS